MAWPGPPVTARALREYIERRLFSGPVPTPEEAAGTNWGGKQAPVLGALLEAIDSLDPRVTSEGLNIEQAFDWSIAVARMRQMLDAWRQGHDRPLTGANAVILYRLLENCPDEPTPRALPRMTFIHDARLRKSIARDIDSLEPLLRDHEWKSATVIGGSVIEAILFDALLLQEPEARAAARAHNVERERRLKQDPQAPPMSRYPMETRKVAGWKLWQRIRVARMLDLIDTALEGACGSARDYRNLIHPSPDEREEPSLATALIVRGAVEGLVDARRAAYEAKTAAS